MSESWLLEGVKVCFGVYWSDSGMARVRDVQVYP